VLLDAGYDVNGACEGCPNDPNADRHLHFCAVDTYVSWREEFLPKGFLRANFRTGAVHSPAHGAQSSIRRSPGMENEWRGNAERSWRSLTGHSPGECRNP
jgi:hypothetical protein